MALASYVASGIARSEIGKTSWTAFAYGITSYVLPFMFFFGPALLMDGTAPEIAVAVVTGVMSVLCFSAAVVGFLGRKLGPALRIVFALLGLVLLYQSWMADVLGIGVFAGLFLLLRSGKPAQEVSTT